MGLGKCPAPFFLKFKKDIKMKTIVEMKKVKLSEVPAGYSFYLEEKSKNYYVRIANDSPYLESKENFRYGLRGRNIEKFDENQEVYMTSITHNQ
jgi:hypothetical protein